VEMLMTQLWLGLSRFTRCKCHLNGPEAHSESAVLISVAMLMTRRLRRSVFFLVRVLLQMLERAIL